ncbi:MAG: YetF domain-containing protein [Oscillospiraceae bacterium]
MNTYVEIILRSVITFIGLLCLALLMGRKQLSQITFFDYVVGITIGSIAAVIAVDRSVIMRKQMNLPFKNVGVPILLIYDGKIQDDNLKGIGQDFTWLDKKLKEKGIMTAKDVFLAAYEGDGTVYISV